MWICLTKLGSLLVIYIKQIIMRIITRLEGVRGIWGRGDEKREGVCNNRARGVKGLLVTANWRAIYLLLQTMQETSVFQMIYLYQGIIWRNQ